MGIVDSHNFQKSIIKLFIKPVVIVERDERDWSIVRACVVTEDGGGNSGNGVSSKASGWQSCV